MTITIIGKVQVRRGTDSELPGAPVSFNPLSFAPGLDIGELGYATDSTRVFIGADPSVGNVNFARDVFPYQNIEVLTESSPRVGELFGQNIRSQDRNDFFFPTVIPPGSGLTALPYTEFEGGIAIPTHLYGASVSAVVEYHAFQSDLPFKQGTLRIFATSTGQSFQEDSMGSSNLVFGVGTQQQDSQGFFYELQAWNKTVNPITILTRRTVIVGLSA